ncbi:NUAK family SNF1-like kinase 2 [Clarias gariepinus]|uniref:NUAK family SNF1-like kinase 2 n=1 Tax=Clarias gariepinus TaxID=13013 RepID=UPI00234CBA28|nr:NUAK family SNF1-like kinase 2 [Clarias gariepinus]
MDTTRLGRGSDLAVGSECQHPDRKCPSPAKRHAVKRHHHKHNLKHRYDFLETLGKGTYGKVQRAVDRTGTPVAIKSIKKENIKDEQDLTHIRREIEIMSSLNHPHIITIYEVFENKDKMVIVMEYASKGDLFDYISGRRVSEREARHIFRQIVSAVHYCHRNGIVHRDLKLENILMDANGDVKIADFGLSNLYRRDEYLQTYCGSPLYASPEIVNGRPYKGPEVDSWSLGVLLYALVHEAMPFDGHDYKTLVRQISTGDYRKPNKPSDACGLIRWMLMVNPDRRATLEEIAGHWWLNWGYQRPLLAENETKATMTTSTSSQTSNSARITDWLRRTSRPLLHSGSKMRCLLRPGGGVTGDTSITRQRSIRRSRKENNVSQSMQENIAPRPFKGILKKRGSLKQKLCGEPQIPPLEEKMTNAVVAPPAAQPSPLPPAPPPRKGILKKPVERERESGYSSSTEGSDSTQTPQPELCTAMPLQQKGILKRNGKFSSGGLQEFREFGSLDQLAETLPTGGIRSRPSIAISEDSILSSESFDRLDLPDRREPAMKVGRPAGGPMRGSVSADNLLDMKESRQELWDTDKMGERKFCDADCET